MVAFFMPCIRYVTGAYRACRDDATRKELNMTALTNAERQAKHRAKRAKLLAHCYMVGVQAALTAQGQESKMDQADYAVVLAGERYGIGPYDCAAQIIANRQDAREV
jgi:hypothetical protein